MQHLDDALDDQVEGAAAITRQTTDHNAENEAHGDAEKADGQRNTGAIDDTGEYVTAETIRAEQEHFTAFGRANEMGSALEQAPEVIGIALAEETQRLDIRRHVPIDPSQIVHVERHFPAVNEGADKFSVIEQVNGLRWGVDVLDIAGMEIIGREEFADQDRKVKHHQKSAGPDRDLVLSELPPHETQLRGLAEGRHS
ncbi:hypothetical protein D3C78_1011580 [compost metagenome]